MSSALSSQVRSIDLYIVEQVDLQEVLPGLGWSLAGGSWLAEGRGWRATVSAGVPVDWPDVPEVVSKRQVGIAWKMEASLTGAETGLSRLTRTLRELARVGHGVVIDGDNVWKPGSSKRLLSIPVKKETQFLALSWWIESGRLSSLDVAEKLVAALGEVLPEAIPYKWSRQVVLSGARSSNDDEDLARSLASPGFSYFEVRAPFTEFAAHHCAWPPSGGGPSRWLNIRGLAIEVAGSVLSQPGWGRHLSMVFRVVSEAIVPFYGEARLQQSWYRGNTRHIENPPPISARHWYGFPRSVPLAMVIGPPYRAKWPLPGGEECGPLLFYTSDAWPNPPEGGVPQAPEPFLQEFDGRWKELPPMFPGMGPGITGDFPSRVPEFWPFQETTPRPSTRPAYLAAPGFLGMWVQPSEAAESVRSSTRRYEWPSVDLGDLPTGSYYKRVAPPVADGDNAGRRRLHQEPSGHTWEEWSENFHRSIEQNWAIRADPRVLPDGAEPASETVDRLMREVVAPALRERGLKGSRGAFHLTRGTQRTDISLQKSVHNGKGLCEFTANLGGLPLGGGSWSRIGHVLPEMGDTWWSVPAGSNTDRLTADLLESFLDYAVPFIETAAEDPAFQEYTAVYSRRFRHDRPVQPRPIFQIYPQPPTFDQLLADALDGNSAHTPSDRAAIIRHACWTSNGDRRCTPILLELVTNEDYGQDRSTAALRLAFTDVNPQVIRPALAQAADQDPELIVRLVARYALKLLDRRATPHT